MTCNDSNEHRKKYNRTCEGSQALILTYTSITNSTYERLMNTWVHIKAFVRFRVVGAIRYSHGHVVVTVKAAEAGAAVVIVVVGVVDAGCPKFV